MSIAETPVTVHGIDELLDLDLGNEVPHLECCRVERFFCGTQFHEELSAPRLGVPIEEVCPNCVQIFAEHACWRGHQHCPIPLLGGLVCPDA